MASEMQGHRSLATEVKSCDLREYEHFWMVAVVTVKGCVSKCLEVGEEKNVNILKRTRFFF